MAALPDSTFRQYLERDDEGVALFDLEGRYVFVNAAMKDIARHRAEDLLGRTIWELFPDRVGTEFERDFHRVSRGEVARLKAERHYAGFDIWTESTIERLDEWIALRLRDVTAKKRADERSRQLQSITAALSRAVTVDDVVRVATADARTAVGAHAAFFGLLDKEGRNVCLTGAVGLSEELERTFATAPLDGGSALARIVRTGEPLILKLSQFRVAFPHIAPLWERAGMSSGMGTPLTVGGMRVGAFGMLFREERTFSEEDVRFFTTLSEVTGQALHRAQSYAEARESSERARRDAERLRLLAEVSRALSAATLDLDQVMNTVAIAASDAVGDSSLMRLISDDGRHLRLVAGAARDEESRRQQQRLKELDEAHPLAVEEPSLATEVLRTGAPVVFEGPEEGAQALLKPAHVPALGGRPFRAAIAVPVRGSKGVLGVLSVARFDTRPYAEEDRTFLQAIADRAGVAVDKTRLYREAREAVQLRDDFLSVAGHELRTPIASTTLVVGALQRALERDPAGIPQRLPERLRTLARQMSRLQVLVDSLLDVSRITSGRMKLQLEEVDLSALTQEVLRRAREDGGAGPELTLQTDAPVAGRWDRLRLESVVSNLLGNALRYGAGSPVEVRVERDAHEALLTVRDYGIGIAPEEQERIFGKFERAVSVNHYGGFGLGLWIVRQIVEAHGGSIGVRSVAGEGATFTVRLPLAPAG